MLRKNTSFLRKIYKIESFYTSIVLLTILINFIGAWYISYSGMLLVSLLMYPVRIKIILSCLLGNKKCSEVSLRKTEFQILSQQCTHDRK